MCGVARYDEEANELFDKAGRLIENTRSAMGSMANMLTVYSRFQIGKYIVEQEQQGERRAKYGSQVLDSLSAYLTEKYGRGFSRSNVAGMRRFYLTYRERDDQIVQSGIGQLATDGKPWPFPLTWSHYQVLMRIRGEGELTYTHPMS